MTERCYQILLQVGNMVESLFICIDIYKYIMYCIFYQSCIRMKRLAISIQAIRIRPVHKRKQVFVPVKYCTLTGSDLYGLLYFHFFQIYLHDTVFNKERKF